MVSRLIYRTHEGFVPGLYKVAYSAFNLICIDIDGYTTAQNDFLK